MTTTDRAALVAWVRAGDEPDLPPRIDQAAARCAAFPHTPRPSWWGNRLTHLTDLAEIYPMIGPESANRLGAGMTPGHPQPALDPAAPPKPRRIRQPRRRSRAMPPELHKPKREPRVSLADILASTYAGDTITDVARRLRMDRKCLRKRVNQTDEALRAFNAKRGKIEFQEVTA